MKKKKIIAIFVVAVTVMMLTPATIADEPEKPTGDDSPPTDDRVYVDPDIYLTTEQLPELRDSIAYIEDDGVSQLVGQIISAIEANGVVTGMDIGMMVQEEGEIDILGITAGIISGTAPGSVWVPLKAKLIGPGGIIWVALTPSIIIWHAYAEPWDDKEINMQVGDNYLHDPHSGIGIGFVGWASYTMTWVNHAPYTDIEIQGAALFIWWY